MKNYFATVFVWFFFTIPFAQTGLSVNANYRFKLAILYAILNSGQLLELFIICGLKNQVMPSFDSAKQPGSEM